MDLLFYHFRILFWHTDGLLALGEMLIKNIVFPSLISDIACKLSELFTEFVIFDILCIHLLLDIIDQFPAFLDSLVGFAFKLELIFLLLLVLLCKCFEVFYVFMELLIFF